MTDTTDLKGANVLIVYGAPANPDLLRSILEPIGCQTFFVTSGEMASKLHLIPVPT